MSKKFDSELYGYLKDINNQIENKYCVNYSDIYKDIDKDFSVLKKSQINNSISLIENFLNEEICLKQIENNANKKDVYNYNIRTAALYNFSKEMKLEYIKGKVYDNNSDYYISVDFNEKENVWGFAISSENNEKIFALDINDAIELKNLKEMGKDTFNSIEIDESLQSITNNRHIMF